MYLFAEVIFYSGQRKHLPQNGYRPDAIFNETKEYWGITFIELPIEAFDIPTPATIKFSFQDCHYEDVIPMQFFTIMEGDLQVGEGKILSIEKCAATEEKNNKYAFGG